MKHKKFFNLDQAIRYLNESVISFQGKPIYIYSLDTGRHNKNFRLFYYDVGDDRAQGKTILSDHSDIDMTPVQLGLLSIKTKLDQYSTGLVTRIPVRLMKIGLNRQNVRVDNTNPHTAARFRSRFGDVLMSKELRDTVANDYLKYAEAYKASKDNGTTLPFSRRFAVCGDALYYKALGVPVGTATKSGPVLDDNCFVLKEALEEDFKNAQ